MFCAGTDIGTNISLTFGKSRFPPKMFYSIDHRIGIESTDLEFYHKKTELVNFKNGPNPTSFCSFHNAKTNIAQI